MRRDDARIDAFGPSYLAPLGSLQGRLDMNPKKARVLESLDQSARTHDASLQRSIDIAAHPEEHGWRKSLLTAAIVVPLTGISAVLTDLSRVLVSHSDDEAWDRVSPPDAPPPDAGAPEQVSDGSPPEDTVQPNE